MRAARFGSALALLVAVGCPVTWAVTLQDKKFLNQELSISSMNVAARALLQAGADRPAWKRFFEAYGSDTPAFVDPRSGTLSNAVLHVPLLPGDGAGNHVTLEQVGRALGHPASGVDASVVGGVVRAFVVANREALGIDVAQLGPERVAQVTDELWQVSIPQQVDGIPVRDGRVLATISHGNLVLLGTETWGNATVDTKPAIDAEDAVAAGFAYVGGKGCKDVLWSQPTLEIVPIAPDGFDPSSLTAATTGAGYGHRLVWTFGFTRADEPERWELIVDAHDGQVLALTDRALALTGRISGGVYPLTATGVCDTSEFCGTMQSGWPMPYADTSLPPPDDYTNGAGLYEYPGDGTTTTTLNGKYVRVLNGCGPMSESSSGGDIDLGGVTGQHDCASTGSAGDTAPARTAYYHINKTIEAARGWLPFQTWLDRTLPIEVHPGLTCSAGYSQDTGSIAFYDGLAGQCLNAAEIATVINHEWGHGLDDHDLTPIPGVNQFSEAYADVDAVLRSQVSCLYYGFKYGRNQGCGVTPDGTGNNANEAVEGGLGFFHCDLQCSGHRDVDWERHADPTPDTPQNFSCPMCGSGNIGPCGGDVHCAARPVVQAAWDFATRDLRAPPFDLSRTDAFIVASKVYYQGSYNVGAWHACNCAAGTSDGCAASSAYMQWLAADDDDGNLANGTPHASALAAAFNRHNVGCPEQDTPTAGCGGGPTAAPTLVAVPGMNRVDLSWSAVPGATRYRVLRTEGQAGCDTGKAVIAETTGLAYSDIGVANGRAYYYLVHAVGASGACFGPTSACLGATPVHCATTISLPHNQVDCDASTAVTLEDWDLAGTGATSVSAFSTTEPAPETLVLTETPPGSGRFTGTIATTGAPASHGDGAVSVVHGDTLRLDSLDASHCGGIDVPVERLAPIDCRGPVITNVHTANEQGTTAEIRWDTDEPATSQVVHGAAIPPERVVGPDPAFVTSHVMSVDGLTACAPELFSVGSSDRLGHATADDHAGAYYTVRTAPTRAPVLSCPGVPVYVPPSAQGAGTLLTIQVPDAEVILDVDVKLNYMVSSTQNMTISLLGPDLTEVVLFNNHVSSGPNLTDTVFDDAAAIAVANGASPYTGTFRPEQPLSAFNGKVAAGPWKLRILFDGAPVSSLEGFELHLTYPSRTCGPALQLGSRTLTDACGTSGAGGANGVVEPGETTQVSFEVVNADAAPATGVSARLSSYTPGVFVTRADSNYPDLAPGAAAYGATPYELYVDPSVACGTQAVLRLDGASNEGGWSSVMTLRVGDEVPVTATYFNTTPKPIPDLATTRSFINVADPWTITDADVGLTIDHGSPADLDVFLVAPDGTRVELTTDNGGSFGSGYASTVFDDEASTSVTAGSSPFTGRFRPESPLSVLDGMQARGPWTLEVTDDHQFIVGTLQRWSLSLSHLDVLPCATCPVSDPPGEVASLAWTGTARDTLSWSAAPRASSYVLHRGLRSQLPALLDARVDSCERTQTTEPTSGAVLTENPPLGSFFWFLVRSDNAFGTGPAGDATSGARILNANDACQ